MSVASHRINGLRSSAFLISVTLLCVVACKENLNDASFPVPDASLTDFGCLEECELDIMSPCTCAPDDPCGWRADGICDRKCLFNEIVEEMFDDTSDCPGACGGACVAGFYTTCSCSPEDPCDWIEDTDCDIACIEYRIVPTMFDDQMDCSPLWDAGFGS